MEFQTIADNLKQLMMTVGTLDIKQVYRFYRNAPNIERLEHIIQMMVTYRIFDYDEKTQMLSWHGAPVFKKDILKNHIYAFWIAADFGYDNIKEIRLLRYPSQLLLISETNDCYDITVCPDAQIGALAARTRKLVEVDGMEDDVNHIAVVYSSKVGQSVLPYGFDSYCIYNSEMEPQYFDE